MSTSDLNQKSKPASDDPSNTLDNAGRVLPDDQQPASEDQALATIREATVTAETLTSIGRDPTAMKSRKVALALVTHARTPRHVSIPLLRRMFTFDLMQIALTPVVAADIKRAAEDQILLRLESISSGEKASLARRSSGRIAAALLQENDERIASPALDNPQLTETHIVQALMKPLAPEQLFALVSRHPKWSLRREVQSALLRSEKTPLEAVAMMSQHFSREDLRQILPPSRFARLFEPGNDPG